ncbi:hypothetical protein AgCh_031110 [Apium graveolens]
MIAGHAYYFLKDVYPKMTGRRPLRTPSFIKSLFVDDPIVVARPADLLPPVYPSIGGNDLLPGAGARMYPSRTISSSLQYEFEGQTAIRNMNGRLLEENATI